MCIAYQGHANYFTWACALWLENDYPDYRGMQEVVAEVKAEIDSDENVLKGIWTAERAIVFRLADKIRDIITENSPGVKGMYSDFLTRAISMVDFQEVAESILAE